MSLTSSRGISGIKGGLRQQRNVRLRDAGEANLEFGPTVLTVAHDYLPPMGDDDPPGDRQSQSAAGFFGRHERFEYALKHAGVYSATAISDANLANAVSV